MPTGQVIRSHSNVFYVLVDGQELECRPRGKFRLDHLQVRAGDMVEVTAAGDGEGRIDRVLPRRSELARPPVANADQCVAVFTLRQPEADLRFLDRLLVLVSLAGLAAAVVLNKVDLYRDSEVAAFCAAYGPGGVGYPVVPVSAQSGTGLGDLRPALAGRLSVLAGQSGVGKSRLVAALGARPDAPVGALSAKLGRGRHTTRHVELLPLPGGGLLADAPGFTHQDFPSLAPRDLAAHFREFAGPAAHCRFPDCLHRAEPDCGVKAALAAGRVLPHRHTHYLEFLQEVEAQRRW